MHSQRLLLIQGTTTGSTVTRKSALRQAAIWPRATITLYSLAGSAVVRAGRGQVAMETRKADRPWKGEGENGDINYSHK